MLRALLLLILLTACEGVQGSSGSSAPPRETPVVESTSAPSGAQAVSVTYTQTGGLAGTVETRHFSLDRPRPAGLSRVDIKTALRAASDPALRTLKMTPLPEDQCCDRFSYVVTIRWDDGSSRTYRSLDGVEQPAAFSRLIGHLP